MGNLDRFINKQIYFISDGDLDGISANIVFEYFFRDITPYYIMYNTCDRDFPSIDMNTIKESDFVFFVDTSPSRELYNMVNKECKGEVFIFDHHQTSLDVLMGVKNFYHDLNKCGTKILFDFCSKGGRVKPSLTEYVNLVDTYDRWCNDSPLFRGALDLHNLMYSYIDNRFFYTDEDDDKFDKFISAQFYKIHKFNTFFYTDDELESINYHREKEKENIKIALKSLKIRTDNSGNTYGFFICKSKMSYVASYILRSRNNIDYTISNSSYNKNTRLSLRSLKIDVSKIASKWGGGGHKLASAVEIKDESDFYNIVEGVTHLN